MSRISYSERIFNPQSTSVYYNGKPIGRVVNGTFHKTINGSKHLLRMPRAIAFDLSTLQAAAVAGATSVRVVDRETGTAYTTTMERIHTKGKPLSRGYGRQWFLLLDQWSVDGACPMADVKAAETNAEIAKLQRSLFDGGA